MSQSAQWRRPRRAPIQYAISAGIDPLASYTPTKEVSSVIAHRVPPPAPGGTVGTADRRGLADRRPGLLAMRARAQGVLRRGTR